MSGTVIKITIYSLLLHQIKAFHLNHCSTENTTHLKSSSLLVMLLSKQSLPLTLHFTAEELFIANIIYITMFHVVSKNTLIRDKSLWCTISHGLLLYYTPNFTSYPFIRTKSAERVSGKLLCITCSDEMVDECVVVLCPEQRAGENYTVEWNIVFCHEVVQLHLQDKWERRNYFLVIYILFLK